MSFFKKAFKKTKESKEVDLGVNIKINTNENEVNPIYEQPLDNGLLPGEVILLDWAENKTINRKPPQYFHYNYGINAEISIEKLLENNFLRHSTPYESLNSLKVNELKTILKDNSLKVSGKKSELINRIKENISEKSVKEYIKEPSLIITDRGKRVFEEYYYIVPAHKNDSKDGVYNVATSLEFVNEFTEDYNPPNGDISWELFQKDLLSNQKNGDFGLVRNSVLNMAVQLNREGKSRDSLMNYIRVFIMDLSGTGNGRTLHKPELVFIAPGIISVIRGLIKEVEISNDELQNLYNLSWRGTRPSIPFHYLTKEECIMCLNKSLVGEEEDVTDLIHKKYESLDKTDFESRYNLRLPVEI